MGLSASRELPASKPKALRVRIDAIDESGKREKGLDVTVKTTSAEWGPGSKTKDGAEEPVGADADYIGLAAAILADESGELVDLTEDCGIENYEQGGDFQLVEIDEADQEEESLGEPGEKKKLKETDDQERKMRPVVGERKKNSHAQELPALKMTAQGMEVEGHEPVGVVGPEEVVGAEQGRKSGLGPVTVEEPRKAWVIPYVLREHNASFNFKLGMKSELLKNYYWKSTKEWVEVRVDSQGASVRVHNSAPTDTLRAVLDGRNIEEKLRHFGEWAESKRVRKIRRARESPGGLEEAVIEG